MKRRTDRDAYESLPREGAYNKFLVYICPCFSYVVRLPRVGCIFSSREEMLKAEEVIAKHYKEKDFDR